MELKFQVQAKIRRPLTEVFDGVYNPGKLRTYFTTGGASGPLDAGTTVMWAFADFEDGRSFPVYVKEVVPNHLITFEWEGEGGGYNTRVEIKFETLDASSTLVSISESGWSETESELRASYGNCSGWMNMADCLKAYLEHGINLREGMF